jgi:hypothetical protein
MKRNFTFKYEMIRKQITETNQMNTIASCDNILGRNERHKYNIKNDVPYVYLSKETICVNCKTFFHFVCVCK